MTKPSAAFVTLATQLCEHECGAVRTSSGNAAAAVRVFEKLFAQLAPVVGVTGVIAVFARSLALTRRDVPVVLAGGKPEAAAEGLFDCFNKLPPDEALAGAVGLTRRFSRS